MRIFITGATGYIGGELAARLVADGHEVRALVRPTSDSRRLRELGAATFEGDVTDRYSMREGMSGADWVVHAAAVVDIRGGSPRRMAEINVGGSDNVASLAYKLGVGRLLSVSSVASFGGSPGDGSRADEGSGRHLPLPGAYSATKFEGQRRIAGWAEQGLAVTTVYPSLVYGPPGKRSGANALLRAFLRGRFPALVGADRLTSWVFVDDVVDGLVRAMERGEPGRGYILAGEVIRLAELVERLCRLGGVRAPRWTLPVGLARMLAALTAPLFRLTGRRPPFAAEQLRVLTRHWAFDDSRARRELGWEPRGLDAGLPPTVELLRPPREP